MKSYRAFFIVLLSFFCISLNAQVFVGGNFSFNTSNDKTDDGATTIHKVSNYNFALLPKVGIYLSEKVAVGLALNISFNGSTSGVNTETISKTSSIGGSPFLRYYAIKWNKVSVFGQGNIGFAFSNSSVKTDGSTTDGPKATNLYLSIYPGISYDINDKLSLETSLNILSLGYNYIVTKDGSTKDRVSNFNIGAGLGNIISVGAITIGGIYKF